MLNEISLLLQRPAYLIPEHEILFWLRIVKNEAFAILGF